MFDTLSALFDQTVLRDAKRTALTHKQDGIWHQITYQEFGSDVEKVTAALIGLGIAPGDRVALLSENRPEWVIGDQGILAAGAVNVPIYPTLAAAQVKYILADSGAKVILLSNRQHLEKVLADGEELPQLSHIVMFDGQSQAAANQSMLTWRQLLDQGQALMPATSNERRVRKEQLTANDLASIIYTSGTTGNPKGVMLSHGNLVSNSQGVVPLVGLRPSDTCLSFLPLSHVFERCVYYVFVGLGATINFAEGIDQLSANLAEVKPTVLVSVPRVFEKIRARVYDAMDAAGGVKAKLFDWAMGVSKEVLVEREKIGSLSPWLMLQHKVADKLVFSKIRLRTGGNLRYAICGGAPLSREVAEFFERIGITLLEGYGMTETSPVITCNTPTARRLGTVGKPIPAVEVKIAADGEIVCRGPNVMKGYFNLPQATAETLDKDGWLHTGDVGEFDGDGYLKITDRKKEILVMSNGKNVAPAPLENALITSPYITQAVILGDNRNFISALLVPNFESLQRWAKGQEISSDQVALSQHPKVRSLLAAELDRLTADFAKFEKIKEFVVLPSELTQENGELTPTLKFKRRVISERYRTQIEKIYSSSAPVGA